MELIETDKESFPSIKQQYKLNKGRKKLPQMSEEKYHLITRKIVLKTSREFRSKEAIIGLLRSLDWV